MQTAVGATCVYVLISLSFSLLLGACADTSSPSAPPRSSVNFISVWQVDATEPTIQLPLVENGRYDFRVDWGDSSKDQIAAWNATEKTHRYSKAGEYTVKISGKFTGWSFKDLTQEARKILEIKQWGSLGLGETIAQFTQASQLTISATDSPDLTGTSSLRSMFQDASALSEPDFSRWNTSEIINMSSMFLAAKNFNGDIRSWDTSKVIDMSGMFENSAVFNQDISKWKTSKVLDMSSMFKNSAVFNQDISEWKTSKVLNMASMFSGASIFNGNISKWDTSKVTNMSGMFFNTRDFNQDISEWNTAKVLNMASMFRSAAAFNHDISKWNTSKVTDISGMFLNASNFDQDINNWNVSSVVYKEQAFKGSGIEMMPNKQPAF